MFLLIPKHHRIILQGLKNTTKNFNEQLKITCGEFPKIHFLKTNFFFHGSLLKFVKKKKPK